MKRILMSGALVLAGIVGVTSNASAVPITGFISFGGNYIPVDSGGTQVSQSIATGVDISADSAIVSCAFNSTCAGTYSALNGNVIVADYNDFQFSPVGGGTTPLWGFSFGGVDYSFNLESVAIIVQNNTFLNLTGTGTLFVTGFDPTAGTWSFSGDTTTGGTFAFSATNAAVPEPGSLALLGLGLLGLAVARRRKQ